MLYAIQICSSLVKLRDNEQFESVPRWELVFPLSQIRTIRAWKHYPTTYLIAESPESHIASNLIDLSYVKLLCFLCSYAQEQLFPCFDKETQTTAFIYCYIDTFIYLSIVKFHIFAVKRKQLELWKALTIL